MGKVLSLYVSEACREGALCYEIKMLKFGLDATGKNKGSNFILSFVLQNCSGFHT